MSFQNRVHVQFGEVVQHKLGLDTPIFSWMKGMTAVFLRQLYVSHSVFKLEGMLVLEHHQNRLHHERLIQRGKQGMGVSHIKAPVD